MLELEPGSGSNDGPSHGQFPARREILQRVGVLAGEGQLAQRDECLHLGVAPAHLTRGAQRSFAALPEWAGVDGVIDLRIHHDRKANVDQALHQVLARAKLFPDADRPLVIDFAQEQVAALIINSLINAGP